MGEKLNKDYSLHHINAQKRKRKKRGTSEPISETIELDIDIQYRWQVLRKGKESISRPNI